MVPRLVENAALQIMDALMPAHALLLSFPTGVAEVVTAVTQFVPVVDPHTLLLWRKVSGSHTWRRKPWQLDSSSLLHGCSHDNSKDGIFPLLSVCSCSIGELSFPLFSQDNPCGSGLSYTTYSKGVVCNWPRHVWTSDSLNISDAF